MIHVCPRGLLKYIEVAKGDEILDIEDLADAKWVNQVGSALGRGEVTVWSSFSAREIGPFTHAFLARSTMLSDATWIGIILHGEVQFQIHGMISALRLIATRGGKVGAIMALTEKLGNEADTLRDYYCDLLAKHEIQLGKTSIILTDNSPILHPAEAALSRPIFELGSDNILRENDFARPYWHSWERESVHGKTSANVCGLPFFLNTSSTILLANLIDHFRPSTVVEVGAYKYGGTTMLLLLTEWLGSKVIAINPPGLEDDPWWNKVSKRSWGSRASRAIWSTSDMNVDLQGQNPVLVLFNWHYKDVLTSLTNQILETYDRGALVYHGDSHLEMPSFLREIAMRPELRKIETIYNPDGGTWCSSGLFEFDNTRKNK